MKGWEIQWDSICGSFNEEVIISYNSQQVACRSNLRPDLKNWRYFGYMTITWGSKLLWNMSEIMGRRWQPPLTPMPFLRFSIFFSNVVQPHRSILLGCNLEKAFVYVKLSEFSYETKRFKIKPNLIKWEQIFWGKVKSKNW